MNEPDYIACAMFDVLLSNPTSFPKIL